MLQIIDEIEERLLGTVPDGKTMTDFVVYADIGKNTKEFFGLTLRSVTGNIERRISFHEFNRMKKTLEDMGAS